MTKTDTQKKAMIEALEKSLGVVTKACKSVGISRQTHYDWMKSDPIYADKVRDLENVALDFAESKLHELINTKNATAIIFFLKTKGKKRGYIENAFEDNKPDYDGVEFVNEPT